MTNEGPLYQHDCDLCRFLGRFAYDAPYGEVVKPLSLDLYVCREQDLDYATFLARRGDESSAYSSYDKGTLERSGLLTNARTTYSPGVVEAYRRFMQEKNA